MSAYLGIAVSIIGLVLGMGLSWKFLKAQPPANQLFNWQNIMAGLTLATFAGLTTLTLDFGDVAKKQQQVLDSIGSLDEAKLLASHVAASRKSREHPIFTHVYERRYKDFQKAAAEAENGRYAINNSDLPEIAYRVIELAKVRIDATSYVNDDQWWNTSWGRLYLAKNREAVGRGVRIRRIFILPSRENFKKSRDLLEKNRLAGVEVYYAFADELRQPFVQDVIFVDDEYVGVLVLNERSVQSVYFSSRQEEIGNVKRSLDVAFESAERYRG